MALTPESFASKLQAARFNYIRAPNVTGPFVADLFALAVREDTVQASEIRRATAGRVQETAKVIDSFLGDNLDVVVGEIARTYWVMTRAPTRRSASVSSYHCRHSTDAALGYNESGCRPRKPRRSGYMHDHCPTYSFQSTSKSRVRCSACPTTT